MPKDADILTVQVQDDKICTWAKSESYCVIKERTLIGFGN